jgi:superfamily I DNA/RNA helicase
MTKLILGGPGCGKTTALLGEVNLALERGVEPYSIGFVAFTRKAADEARDRASKRFSIAVEDLPHFRTLHSMAFAVGGFTPQEMMTSRDMKEFGDWCGLTINVPDQPHDEIVLTAQAELDTYALSRLKCVSLEEQCYESNINYERTKWVADHYNKWKAHNKKHDFTDLIERFVERNDSPHFDLLIIDEAQDLSPLQWKMAEILCANADEVIIAGDDDQAIFEWAGADVSHFLAIRAETRVLPKSFRLPSTIHGLVRRIADRIEQRFTKEFTYNKEGGTVELVPKISRLNFETGSWLVLASTNYLLNIPRAHLREEGFPYYSNGLSSTDTPSCRALIAWERLRKNLEISSDDANLVLSRLPDTLLKTNSKFKGGQVVTMNDFTALGLTTYPDWMDALLMPTSEREYFRAIKKRGESLIKPPRITVATIHTVKGGEADSVALYTDMSAAAYRSLVKNPSTESRVFYVGASRARENLHIIDPRSAKAYRMPI